ncbi:hypothetical protein MKX01_015401 [Papaver californicum]|nr:hypothetical protein MKX01_015401 [Papaver californicum]
MLNVISKLMKAFMKNGSSLDDFMEDDLNLEHADYIYVEPQIEFTRSGCASMCLIFAAVSFFFIWATYEMYIRRNDPLKVG